MTVQELRIGPNTRVVLEYTLRDSAGEVLDSSSADEGEPMVFVHGYGMVVPGLERQLAGLAVGDARDIVVSPEEGYGERDEELVLTIDRSEVPRPRAVQPGDELVAESADGDEAVMRVVEVHEDSVVVDGNHPLAGQTLHYAIVVKEVRRATEEEIAEAATAFEEAGYEEASAHEHPQNGLVQLGRPKRRD